MPYGLFWGRINLTKGSADTILKELHKTEYGEHVIVIHPHIATLSKAYSHYAKTQLVNNNETVLLLPYYEATDAVKKNISESNGNSSNSRIDIQNHEKEGSLVIVDGVKAQFKSDSDIVSFISRLVKNAENTGKTGISIFVDMGSFYHFGKPDDDVIEHELSLPSRYHHMNMKRFCIYHEKDFGRLREENKQTLRKHHTRELRIIDTS